MEEKNSGDTFSIEEVPAASRERARKKTPQPTSIPYTIKTAADIMRNHLLNPVKYRKIMGDLITEGDITIIWGPPGSNKTTAGLQLAQAIATGQNFFKVPLNLIDLPDEDKTLELVNELPPMPVLYVDFEMGEHKLNFRYAPFMFDSNVNLMHFENFAVLDRTMYINAISAAVKENGFKIVIIDNLSNILLESEKGAMAVMFMNTLKQLAKEHELTLILMNHSNKMNRLDIKETSQMKGNANLENYADSVFCISPSTESESTRYIKQQKCRYGEVVFGSNNVIRMDVIKRSSNDYKGLMGLAFGGYDNEAKLLSARQMSLDETISMMLELDVTETAANIARKLHPLFGSKSSFKTFERRIASHIKTKNLRERAIASKVINNNDDNTITL